MAVVKPAVSLVFALSLVHGVSAAAAGTTETLYITNGDAKTIQAIQGNVVTISNTATPGIFHYAISVRDTIWTADYRAGTPGRQEYTPALVPTANSGPFTTPVGSPEVLDGATDGANNYTINDGTGAVLRYNPDWSGSPTTMFTAVCGNGFCPGITYDSKNPSLWVADEFNIAHYSMGGTPLGSFAHNAGGAGGLAYESSTDTLWLVDNESSNTLRQYSKAGALLQTVTTTTSYSGNTWGAEFRFLGAPVQTAVPTLSQWALILLAGLLSLGTFVALRRQRR